MARLIILPLSPQWFLMTLQWGPATLVELVAAADLAFVLSQYHCACSFSRAY